MSFGRAGRDWLQRLWFEPYPGSPAARGRNDFLAALSFYLRMTLATLLLWPFHLLFLVLGALRRLAYRAGWKTSTRLNVPVVVVGNLTVGGAGKTPLTLWLADQLRLRGYHPGIVSRGYGRAFPHVVRAVSVDDAVHEVGDEPLLLAQRAQCPVWVGARRAAAGEALLAAQPEVDILLCDDGLQHLALQRDAEVAVFDGRGVGNGWRLPLGPLRESLSRLHAVTAVVCNGPADPRVSHAAKALPVFAMSLQAGTFYRLGQPEQRSTAAELARRAATARVALHAVAGIGHPERFFAMLKQLGLVCEEKAFPDHYAYGPADLAFATGGILLLTEKDAVKCAAFYPGEAWVLPVEAKISPALADIVLEKIHGRPSA